MKKNRKKLIGLLALCVLLAASILLYLVIPAGNTDSEDAAEETAEAEIEIDTIDSETVEKLEFRKSGKTGYVLKKKGKKWKLAGQKNVPLDETKVSDLFSCMNPVTASKTLEKSEDSLARYGLSDPDYTILVTTDEGTYRYDIGMEVPVEGGYYALCSSDEDAVYCLSDSMVSDLDINTNTLIVRDEMPEINEDYMVYLHVNNKNGEDFEASYAEKDKRVDTDSEWNITKPYEKPLATSIKDWNTILGYFNALTLGDLVEYDAGDLSKYGLSDPQSLITIRYFETTADYQPEESDSEEASSSDNEEEEVVPEKYRKYHTLKICVGKKKGDSYYVCFKGAKNVYLGNGDVIRNMTELDVFEAMNHCVYATLATKIDGYEAIYGDQKLTVTRTPVEPDENETDTGKSESKNKEQNTWTLNGKEISEEDESEFLTPYSTAYLLEYTSVADDKVKPKSKKPVLTMIYHEGKRDVKVSYYPYDGTNFYRVDRDGMDYFLVDKRSVDDIIERFKNIEKLAQ